MVIGKKEFQIGQRTYIMGILNITPDSFSDGGRFFHLDMAVAQAGQMLLDGADIIDIGGESTRPGHLQISVQEEIKRVVPVIQQIKKQYAGAVISIDTYKAEVAQAAVNAGADMINDIWAFQYDPGMALLAARTALPCCLMHNRNSVLYDNLIEDITSDLKRCVAMALRCGVKRENILLDPGIGFGKTYEQNIEVMKHLEYLKEALGFPMLLGTSRKSMIGRALGDLPPSQRLEGTLATTVMGIMKGCDFIRVHDVLENKRACVMVDAIQNYGDTGRVRNGQH